MSDSLELTVVYEPPSEEGWIVASIPEVSGAHSQGRTRQEARANVIDAARGLLELRFEDDAAASEAAGEDREPLKLILTP